MSDGQFFFIVGLIYMVLSNTSEGFFTRLSTGLISIIFVLMSLWIGYRS